MSIDPSWHDGGADATQNVAPDGDMDRSERFLASDDLGFARACAAAQPDALSRFERELLPRVRGALRRFGDEPFVDDVVGALRDHVLPPPAGVRGTIAQFSGRASLVE